MVLVSNRTPEISYGYGMKPGEAAQQASDVAGERIRIARERRGWSQAQLAAACATAGAPELTKQVVGTIERGRRSKDGTRTRLLTVEEVIAFAAALAVPPVWLLTPLHQRTSVKVTETRDALAPYALEWFIADEVAPPWNPGAADLRSWRDARADVILVRAYMRAVANIRDLMRASAGVRAAVGAKAVERLEAAEAALWARSLVPAELPGDVADQAAAWSANVSAE